MPSLKLLDISGADPDAYESGEVFADSGALIAGTLQGRPAATPRAESLIGDRGLQILALTMQSGCLSALQKLFLHRQPRIGAAGLGRLQQALTNGACGKLSLLYLEGHNGTAQAVQSLGRVMHARGINCDLFQVEEEFEQ